jgi:hypothetical protein
MGCRTGGGTRRLRSRPRGFHWRRAGWIRRQRRMVSLRSAGSLCAVVSRERSVCESRQRQQYDGERHAGEHCLSHDNRKQHHEHHERDVCKPQCSRCGDGGSAARIHQRTAGRESAGSSKRAADRVGAHERESCGGADAGERAGIESGDCGSRDRAAGCGCKPASCRQENSTSAARAFCPTAAGTGRASRTAVGEKRSAEFASRQRRGCASDGEASASGKTGDGDHWPSCESARQSCETWSTCVHASGEPAGEAACESAGKSSGCE